VTVTGCSGTRRGELCGIDPDIDPDTIMNWPREAKHLHGHSGLLTIELEELLKDRMPIKKITFRSSSMNAASKEFK